MTAAVLLFQAFVAFTIAIARVTCPKNLSIVCAGWTVFTLLFVFASPLILLQLVVVWGTYSILRPKSDSNSDAEDYATASGPSDVFIRTPLQPASPLEAELPSARTDTLVNPLSERDPLRARSRLTPGGVLATVDRYLTRQQAVHAATCDLERAVCNEKIHVEAALGSAKLELRAKALRQKSEAHRKAYDEAYENLGDLLARMGHDQPAQASLEPAPDFSLTALDTDPETADAVQRRMRELANDRERFLSGVLTELRIDRALKRAFWKKMLANGQPMIRDSFVAFARSQSTFPNAENGRDEFHQIRRAINGTDSDPAYLCDDVWI